MKVIFLRAERKETNDKEVGRKTLEKKNTGEEEGPKSQEDSG